MSRRRRADYSDGVLTVRIPVAEQAKARRIEIARGEGTRQLDEKISA